MRERIGVIVEQPGLINLVNEYDLHMDEVIMLMSVLYGEMYDSRDPEYTVTMYATYDSYQDSTVHEMVLAQLEDNLESDFGYREEQLGDVMFDMEDFISNFRFKLKYDKRVHDIIIANPDFSLDFLDSDTIYISGEKEPTGLNYGYKDQHPVRGARDGGCMAALDFLRSPAYG